MPIFKPKPEPDYPMPVEAATSAKKEKRYPRVYIPVSPEIIAALEVGGPVVVELEGKVVGLESRQSDSPAGGRNELNIEIRVVEAYPSEEAEEADEEGGEKEPDMKGAIDKGLGYDKKKK